MTNLHVIPITIVNYKCGKIKDFMNINIATVLVALDCHVTDMLDIIINVN